MASRPSTGCRTNCPHQVYGALITTNIFRRFFRVLSSLAICPRDRWRKAVWRAKQTSGSRPAGESHDSLNASRILRETLLTADTALGHGKNVESSSPSLSFPLSPEPGHRSGFSEAPEVATETEIFRDPDIHQNERGYGSSDVVVHTDPCVRPTRSRSMQTLMAPHALLPPCIEVALSLCSLSFLSTLQPSPKAATDWCGPCDTSPQRHRCH